MNQYNNKTAELRYLSSSDWDRFAASFSDVLHEQTHAFNEARWGNDKCEYVGVWLDDELIGGAAIIVMTPPVVNSGIAILKWGPVWRKPNTPVNEANLALILAALKEEYAGIRGLYLTVMPRGEESSALIEEMLQKQQFDKGSQLPAPTRYLVNTYQTAEELRKNLSSKWRYNLKQSLKNEFEISIVDGEVGYDAFISLYQQMLDRKKFHDHSAIYTLRHLVQLQSSVFKPQVVLVRYEGSVCAGAVIETSGDTAVYLYGASDERALPLRAGYAMHWFIAEKLCESAATQWYDLGGNDRDAGLHQFKKGFIGKNGLMCDCPPNYHYSEQWLPTMLGKAVFATKDLKTAISNRVQSVKMRLAQ